MASDDGCRRIVKTGVGDLHMQVVFEQAVVVTQLQAQALTVAHQVGLRAYQFATQHGVGIQPRQPLVEPLPAPGGGQVFVELIPVPLDNGRILLLGRDVTLERNLRAALCTLFCRCAILSYFRIWSCLYSSGAKNLCARWKT